MTESQNAEEKSAEFKEKNNVIIDTDFNTPCSIIEKLDRRSMRQ